MNGLRVAANVAAMVVFPVALAGAVALAAIDLIARRDHDRRVLAIADEAESWLHSLYESDRHA